MGRLVIYGAGGFGREVLRHARAAVQDGRFDSIAFASDDRGVRGGLISGYPLIHPEDFLEDDRCVLAASSAAARRAMASRCPSFATLIASTAVLYDDVSIGEGAILADFAIVTADARTTIGLHFQINTHSTVGHDSTIGDFVTVGPKASVNGNVVLEDDVYVGCGAHLRNGTPDRPLHIGRGAVIGMGAIVTKDVAPMTVVVGNPATAIRSRDRAAEQVG